MSDPGTPYAKLAAHWAKAGAAGPDLLAATRDVLASLAPEDLPGAAGLIEVLTGLARSPESREPARQAIFSLLDVARRRRFVQAVAPDQLDAWNKVLVGAIDRADYTLGELLRSREQTDPRTTAMKVLGADGCEITVADLARRTRAIARGLVSIVRDEPDARVAILSENSLESALCDLACLTNGIVDFPLPANAVAEHVVYMLRHSRARVLLASDEEQLAKVLPSLSELPDLRDIILFSRASAERHGLLSLDQLIGHGGAIDEAARAARAAAVRSRDLATVMYTSGTTGRPKGIQFTHLNIVSKRMCRGLALPHIGEGDVFLCYLPLYHTFGRWLEMTGTLWWGATYVFARSTAQQVLHEDFRSVKPTVFISVPKKWMELHDASVQAAASEDPAETAAHLRAVTGGRLRYGLSAAGYLDPVVFRAFHRAGVDLLSGYGMTEATGGITMTPPGEYVDGSIGLPLPGVECRRADDGELLIRGPYVSPGYFDPEEGESGVDADGWFATGDLVSIDPSGHYRITGRKKEIYKNRAGQTIAPQRVENLFRDFDAVAQAFLVGDHRDYNTLLVWPAYDRDPSLKERSPEELRDLLSSLVASANRFVAPFERVVTFQVLPRALDAEHGEITHKNTFKRDVVEENWKDVIEKMYEQKNLALSVDGMFLRVPNWVLREMGVLQHDVRLEGHVLWAGKRPLNLGAEPDAPRSMRIGDLAYTTDGSVLDLGALLARPALWLGNEALRAFLGEEAFFSLVTRRRKGGGDLRLDSRLWFPPAASRLPQLLDLVERAVSYQSIHAAGELLRAERPEARRAIAHLEIGLSGGHSEYAALCRALLRRAADAPDDEVRRRAFRVLLPGEEPAETLDTLRLFLDRLGPLALRDEDLADFGERGLSESQIEVLLSYLSTDRVHEPPASASDRRLLVGTMRLLVACATARPSWYAWVRVPLAHLTLHDDDGIAARAEEELDRLRREFSAWIGPNLRRAIDPATGAEYGWREVVTLDGDIENASQETLLKAIADTTLVRASVFLFGKGALISLADLPPGGASVTLLGKQHGKSVYRLSLLTRGRESYDMAINLAEAMPPIELRDEIRWLLAAGAPPPLVEAFGGYYPEYGIFTEEFIPGENVERQVARLMRQGDVKRLKALWPFLATTALSAHVGFWDRTGRKLALRHPSPAAFIVPSHDYQTGARLVSISDRSRCTGFDELLDRFQDAFLERVEFACPELRGEVKPAALLASTVEALGLERARVLLETAREGRRGESVATFLDRLRDEGYTPQLVHFAGRRYHRWLEVNPGATLEARGRMLGELWGTYRLAALETAWPDTRIRFFRRTVFATARPEVQVALDRLMARARSLPPGGLDLEEQVASIRGTVRPTAEEDYFLARMTFRHLAPGDEASLISLPSGDRFVTDVAVTISTVDGERFSVRGPVTPREVARLLQMFHESNLQVTFTADHEFLLVLDTRDNVVGGVFYRFVAAERVHFEKVVIARKHRGKNLSDALMGEFARRLRGLGVRTLETGFFQPDVIRRYGFRTDPTSGGLVLDLAMDDRAGSWPDPEGDAE